MAARTSECASQRELKHNASLECPADIVLCRADGLGVVDRHFDDVDEVLAVSHRHDSVHSSMPPRRDSACADGMTPGHTRSEWKISIRHSILSRSTNDRNSDLFSTEKEKRVYVLNSFECLMDGEEYSAVCWIGRRPAIGFIGEQR